MIVSHEHKFIFIKTRKTAGTSIEIALSQYCGPDDIITPMSEVDEAKRSELGFRGAQNYLADKSEYGFADWLRLLRGKRKRRFFNHVPASVVREQVGVDIWEDYFKFTFERNPYDKAVSKYFWSTKKKQPPPEINDYLQKCAAYKISNWDLYSLDDKLAVDFVGKFENLAEDLQKVQVRLSLPGELVLPHTKGKTRKDKRHYSELLNDKTRQRLDLACQREIELLDYGWERQ
ncbi:sulfotransferase family 2 domain-containing protein [Halieaceae bacterium]|nr:sulfotransferase family 2 domain-containing protein [Halieaceae bacterium]